MTDRQLTVAVLGTGIMGGPMAANMVRAGLSVRVWNRTRAKAEAADGAVVCDAPAEAAADADVLVTMLYDAASVEAVMTDEVFAALGDGAVWAQTTTVGVSGTERLAALAREHGVAYVDAPVLGTRQPAEQGTLVVLAAGPEAVRDRVAPVFDAIGSRTVWVGPGTEASRLKLVVNSWVLALTTAVGEAVALAEGLGLDPGLFFSVIGGGSLDVPYAHIKGGAIMAREFPASFKTETAAKDATLIAAAGREAGLSLRLAEAVRDQMNRATELGHGGEDMAAVFFAARASG